jgi:hypothetical protein
MGIGLTSLSKKTVGRNHPCPCGSGVKFKKCCGSFDKASNRIVPGSPLERAVQQAYRQKMAEIAQTQKQQGLGRGIVSGQLGGRRIVAVGNRIWHSPRWKTFHDFLDEYLVRRLGVEWLEAETAKPESARNTIVRWRMSAFAEMAQTGVQNEGVYRGAMTGAQRAYLNVGYNIYLIAHHAAGNSDRLLETFLSRLRSGRSDDFNGKLFETYAAAAFLKAGFQLEYENESVGGKSHVEFTATYPRTAKKFSVEVKTRNRAAGDNMAEADEYRRLRVNSKLLKALQKDAAHTRVVMIEINVPDVIGEASLAGWPGVALEQIRQAENAEFSGKPPLPPAYVLVTNHAFHNNLVATSIAVQALAVGFKISDFGPDVAVSSLAEVLETQEKHKEMFALIDSMKRHYEIPSTFNGENPEEAFAAPSDVPRLKFGERYEIPLPEGAKASGRLYDAIVSESGKSVMGLYETEEGNHVFVKCPISDAEIAAWKRHPDTYFGEIRETERRANNWLELALFFHETYKLTSREKLAEWVEQFPDAENFRSMSQAELAIIYSERMAQLAEWNQRSSLSTDLSS